MPYLIVFLEGIATFVSPCLLPLLPVYFIYFSAGNSNKNQKQVLKNTLGFILGFSIVFVLLGVFSGSLGYILRKNQRTVDIIAGIIIILFGLNFTGILNLKFLNNFKHSSNKEFNPNGFSSFITFGIIFSISFTPCLTAYLGTAIILASKQGTILKGTLMLLLYSIGLAIPFLLSSILLDKLGKTFDFIKRNMNTISVISGTILIIIGLIMSTGYYNKIFYRLGG